VNIALNNYLDGAEEAPEETELRSVDAEYRFGRPKIYPVPR
jgi:hypothetical protein